jgi:serine/threonine-protein kinase
VSQPLIKDRYLVQRVLVNLDYVTRTVCVDTILGREVLLTQLQGRTGRQAAAQERFQTEARRAAPLTHAHVVALYDVDTWNGLPIAIQEFAPSETLRDVINHEGPFHPDDVGILVEHVAEALDFADQRGVHHLALRPEVIHIDYDGQALVSDFGIGHVLDELAAPTLAVVSYRAPEQLAGESGAGHLADVYALGAIAYEMLTGRLPFGPGTADQYAAHAMEGTPPPPSTVRPEVPPAVSAIVSRAIARHPVDRFPTAAAFADALVNWRDATPARRMQPAPVGHGEPGLEPTETLATLDLDDDESGDKPPSRWTALLAWAAVAIGVLALAWAGYQLLGSSDPGGNDEPTAIAIVLPTATAEPDAEATTQPTAVSLIGTTLDQAEALTDARIRASGSEPSDSVPEGQIIRQSPEPGQPLTSNEIVVVLSTGPTPIDLVGLDLVGLAFDVAAQDLTSVGLNVLRVDEGSDSVPEGRVIRVDEASARPGDTIHLVVSMGNRVQIPQDLLSMPVDEAVEALQGLGLDVREPVAVSGERIESAGVDLTEFDIEDGDVVGIQEEDAGFGFWIPSGSAITLVYFDSLL